MCKGGDSCLAGTGIIYLGHKLEECTTPSSFVTPLLQHHPLSKSIKTDESPQISEGPQEQFGSGSQSYN